VPAEVKGNRVEQPLVVVNVPFAQGGVAEFGGGGEAAVALGRGVGKPVGGRGGDEHGGLGRALDFD